VPRLSYSDLGFTLAPRRDLPPRPTRRVACADRISAAQRKTWRAGVALAWRRRPFQRAGPLACSSFTVFW